MRKDGRVRRRKTYLIESDRPFIFIKATGIEKSVMRQKGRGGKKS